MRFFGALTLFATIGALTAPAAAQPAPREVQASAPKAVSVTIYRDNLALITETREVELPGGPARVVFDGVLDQAIPQSAILRGFEGAEAERNFDFDGLNGRALLLRSIGDEVVIRRTNRGNGVVVEETAVIQAAGDGVTLKFPDRYEALGCSGTPEQIIFPRIPDGLRARPALSTLLTDTPAGRREITLSYLATGIEWQTDYVITLNEDATRADVTGWITVENAGEEGFADATVGVVAGDLSRTFSDVARANFNRMAQRACWSMDTTTDFPPDYFSAGIPPPPPPPPPMMAAPVAEMARAKDDQIMVTGSRIPAREELGDYQLYRFPERTTVAPRQTKQIVLIAKPDVAIDRVLRWRVDDVRNTDRDPDSLDVVLRSRNEEARGLGEPLPKGEVNVYAPYRQHGLLVAGSDSTRDTPVGVEWEMTIADSFDVTARRTTARFTTAALPGDRRRITADVEIEVANATNRPQNAEIAQGILGASQRLSNARWNGVATQPGVKDGEPLFRLTLAPNARGVLSYRITYIEE
ncbi:MAG: hypothetical protein JNM47_17435 [Hyphomonadaceae bacterium]|nr:hypothetical protein [Hyphomonadaceae bacterium]